MYYTSPKGLNMTTEKVRDLIEGPNSLGNRITAYKLKHPKFEDTNMLFRFMKPYRDSKTGRCYIRMASNNNSDKWIADQLTSDWAGYLTSEDPELRQIGNDLIPYSFYSSGFNKGLHSLHHYIPPQQLKVAPDSLGAVSYDDFTGELKEEMNKENLELFSPYAVKRDAMLNNADLLTPITKGTQIKLVSDSLPILTFDGGMKYGFNYDGDVVGQNIIRFKYRDDGTFTGEYVGYRAEGGTNVLYYKVIDYKGLQNSSLGIKFYEYNLGDRSIFKENQVKNFIDERDIENSVKSLKGHDAFIYVAPDDRYNYTVDYEPEDVGYDEPTYDEVDDYIPAPSGDEIMPIGEKQPTEEVKPKTKSLEEIMNTKVDELLEKKDQVTDEEAEQRRKDCGHE
jgi:hypothetical protein